MLSGGTRGAAKSSGVLQANHPKAGLLLCCSLMPAFRGLRGSGFCAGPISEPWAGAGSSVLPALCSSAGCHGAMPRSRAQLVTVPAGPGGSRRLPMLVEHCQECGCQEDAGGRHRAAHRNPEQLQLCGDGWCCSCWPQESR